ncbi:Notch-regulated ankyrin repeat-containing protein [Armadillidium nasatum]|uniref:Notch-regulated ankyrin repeat-containing protein n=1 Tax=Armadillidium nasatum TaxID=96803 RepID=A0A5N5SIA4_9CRUS|nr:Notch-regulated ankyrin repeat-containing protein [Armadillidium nasatum]
MKVERSGSVCSEEAPSSPESVISSDNSPVASPQPSETLSDPFEDNKDVFSSSYNAESTSVPSPVYNYPPSPYDHQPQSPEYSRYDFPPSPEDFSPGFSPYSAGAVASGYYDETDQFGCQAEFLRAVQDGNPRELKQILTRYSQLVQINGFTGDGQTALTQSCLDGNLELVKLLVSHGASIQLTNRDGFSPLHLACWCGKIDIMQYLLRTAASRR